MFYSATFTEILTIWNVTKNISKELEVTLTKYLHEIR